MHETATCTIPQVLCKFLINLGYPFDVFTMKLFYTSEFLLNFWLMVVFMFCDNVIVETRNLFMIAEHFSEVTGPLVKKFLRKTYELLSIRFVIGHFHC